MRPSEATVVVPPLTAPPFDSVAASAEPRAWALEKILSPSGILLDAWAATKREALWLLSGLLAETTGGSPDALMAALLRRERLGPTYIGDGMAMPHAHHDASSMPAAAVLRLRQPVDCGTSEGDVADILVAVIWPQADPPGLVPTLARVGRFLRTPSVGRAIRQARNPGELHFALAEAGVRG